MLASLRVLWRGAANPGRKRPRPPVRFRPTLEALEERCLLSPAPADHFALGKSTYALVAKTPEADGDLGTDPNDPPYQGTLTYADGSTSGSTVVVDPADPTLLDVYATHQFKSPGVNTVQIRIDEAGEPGDGFNTTAMVTVPFPTYAEILADPGVQAKMAAAWEDTLAYTRYHHLVVGDNLSREEAFYILLNTDTGTYQFTATQYGRPFAPLGGAEENLNPAPRDIQGHLYEVAFFHTHSANGVYLPAGYSRRVGPSGIIAGQVGDVQAAFQENAVGLVYDFVGVGGKLNNTLKLSSPAQVYHFGPVQRSLAGLPAPKSSLVGVPAGTASQAETQPPGELNTTAAAAVAFPIPAAVVSGTGATALPQASATAAAAVSFPAAAAVVSGAGATSALPQVAATAAAGDASPLTGSSGPGQTSFINVAAPPPVAVAAALLISAAGQPAGPRGAPAAPADTEAGGAAAKAPPAAAPQDPFVYTSLDLLVLRDSLEGAQGLWAQPDSGEGPDRELEFS